MPDRTSGRAGREKPFARGAKGVVGGCGDPLSRLTAPALPKGEPTKGALTLQPLPLGEVARESVTERAEWKKA